MLLVLVLKGQQYRYNRREFQSNIMSSENSSFRDMFEFPHSGHHPKEDKKIWSHRHNKFKKSFQKENHQKDNFYAVIQRVKNVAKFIEKMKAHLVGNRTLNDHTLKPQELEYLEQDSIMELSDDLIPYDNKLVLTFQFAFALLILLFMWKNSFEIVFGELEGSDFIEVAALSAFLLNVGSNLLSEHKKNKEEVIKSRSVLFQFYLKDKLGWDLVFLASLVLQMTGVGGLVEGSWLSKGLRVVSLVIYLEWSQKCKKIEDVISISNEMETMISVVKLFFKILCFLHTLSIVLNLASIIQDYCGVTETWVVANKVSYNSNLELYVVGWYWGATILSTVGFGDIIPGNVYERFFISIIEVTCCMSFGFFVNVIGTLIQVHTENKEINEKEMRRINRYLSSLAVPSHTKAQIRSHFSHKQKIDQIYDQQQEQGILAKLTPNLKAGLLEKNYMNILSKCAILDKFCHEDNLRRITQFLKKIAFAPEHVIYSHTTTEKKLWFIEQGAVEEYFDRFGESKANKKIAVYDDSERVLGWTNYISTNKYSSLAKTNTFTIAYEIEDDDFTKVIRENPHDYHRLMEMRQKMIEKNRKFLNKCLSCDRYTHNVLSCPRIHFIPKDAVKIIRCERRLNDLLHTHKRGAHLSRERRRLSWKGHFQKIEDVKTRFSSFVCSYRVEKSQDEEHRFSHSGLEGVMKLNMQGRPSVQRVSVLQNLNGGQRFSIDAKKTGNSRNEDMGELKLMQANSSEEAEMEEEEELVGGYVMFDHMFCNQEFKDYMPESDISEVLANFAKYVRTKRNVISKELATN